MLTKQLADEIVEQTMIRLNRNLNVMDTNGMILASGEEIRINKIHEGAAYRSENGGSFVDYGRKHGRIGMAQNQVLICRFISSNN